jgi:hypothetical protein
VVNSVEISLWSISRDDKGGQDFIIIKYADGRVFVDVHSLYKI